MLQIQAGRSEACCSFSICRVRARPTWLWACASGSAGQVFSVMCTHEHASKGVRCYADPQSDLWLPRCSNLQVSAVAL